MESTILKQSQRHTKFNIYFILLLTNDDMYIVQLLMGLTKPSENLYTKQKNPTQNITRTSLAIIGSATVP